MSQRDDPRQEAEPRETPLPSQPSGVDPATSGWYDEDDFEGLYKSSHSVSSVKIKKC